MSDESETEAVEEEGDDPHAPSKRLVLEAVAVLPAEVRSEIIDELLDIYCSVCAEHLDVEGECPEGCDPEAEFDDEDDEDDEEDEEPET